MAGKSAGHRSGLSARAVASVVTKSKTRQTVGQLLPCVQQEAEFEDLGEASPISLAEVSEVVKKLLSGKAPGVDEICLEMLKALDIVGLSCLTSLFNVRWSSGTVPVEWHTGVVVHIFKKGDWRVCSNYMGNTLPNLSGKVYVNVESILVMEYQ